MIKAAIVVLAHTESHADLGRVVNAPQAANEFYGDGDEVNLLFDGAGTQWVPELEDPEHPSKRPLRIALRNRGRLRLQR